MDLQNNELEILRIFSKKAKDIANHAVFKENRLQVSINIKWEKGGPTYTRITAPEYQELLPIVTIVRQSYMENESISFVRVYSIVYQHLAKKTELDPRIMDCVKSAMSGFRDLLRRERLQFSIRMDKKALGPREIVDIWFNGNMFHSDIEKLRKYERLWTAPTGPLADFVFRSTILELANLMVYFGGIIDSHILGDK